MVNEDYLACSAYEGHSPHETATDFSAFFHEETQQYFFALLDADGKVLLKSEGYPQPAARENGIQSVIKNRINRDYYSVKEDDGRSYLSLRAANYREIARSCHFDSEGEAVAELPFVTGEQVRGGVQAAMAAEPKERANDRVDDDYMACKSYAGHSGGENGLVPFTSENGEYYFAWYDDAGNAEGVLMRSEGYPTTSARDNGMASVLKNRDLEERYAILEKMGRYFVILKAGNHQEIARSCPYDSEAAARAIFPSGRAETARLQAEAEAAAAAAKAEEEATATRALAAQAEAEATAKTAEEAATAKAAEEAATAKAAEEAAAASAAALAATAATAAAAATTEGSTSDRREDNYLACRQYDGHEGADEDGFTKWQHSNGQYYFTWLDDNGKVKMRSEGYPTTTARDNGVDSVMRNRDNPDRYKVVEISGKTFVTLRAGNHQEIARSCPKEGDAAIWAMFPLLAPADVVAAREMEATDDITPVDIEDDYLPCRDYHGHMTAPRDGFRVFISNKTNKYYFAVVDADDDVSLRSEGHLTAAERDADLADVVQNMLKKERYEIKHVGLHHYFIVLRNADGKEIARSCGLDSLTAVYAAAPFLNPEKPTAKIDIAAPLASIAATVIGSKVATDIQRSVEAKSVVEAPLAVAQPMKDIEDDYLPCREYEGKTISDKMNNVVLFKHTNGQYYFAVYNANGSVRLRSEGFQTIQERDSELSGVLTNLNNADMYTTIRRGEYYISVLKDASGREVGRSCMHKDEPAPVVAPVVAPSVSTDVEDDYLPCREYEGKNINDKANNVAMFKHSNGQFYFAVYNTNGSVRLRSEGFKTSQERDKELSGVLKNLNNADMYTTIRRGDYYISVLKDKTGREVGRSCMHKDEPVAVIVPPVVDNSAAIAAAAAAAAATALAAKTKAETVVETPKVAAEPFQTAYVVPEVAEAVTKETGFNWWWLLFPLLALLAWMLMGKGCNTTPAAPAAVTVAPVETPKVQPAAPVVPVACPACSGASTDAIFTSVCDNPKKLPRLGTNPEFGNSHDLSPQQFYAKLKKRHATNDVDKAFLDKVFTAMGYNGFAGAKPEQFSAVTLPVGTSGRLGYSAAHKTGCYTLPDAEYHRLAFHIKAANGCDLHFMKTCGNHFFFCNK